MKSLFCKPLKLAANRVWRTYCGGKLLDELQGVINPQDAEYPEQWSASVVTARNRGKTPMEGISFLSEEITGKRISLKRLIKDNPKMMLGETHLRHYGTHPGVLIKLLDSAERLTIQVHPDKDTSMRMFKSIFGKTEAWYVLGGREIEGAEPYVLLGFKPGITEKYWRDLFHSQDVSAMCEALHRFPLKQGELFLIEGGVPHAVGPGCFLVEIQEPTDYTIRMERKNQRGQVLPDELCHQGVGFENIFSFFSYVGYTKEEARRKWCVSREKLDQSGGGEKQRLIGYKNTPCFAMDIIKFDSETAINTGDCFSVLLVLSGTGFLRWAEGEVSIRMGEEIFIPAGVGTITCVNKGSSVMEILQCYPPE